MPKGVYIRTKPVKIWNKGLTKKDHPSIASQAEKISKIERTEEWVQNISRANKGKPKPGTSKALKGRPTWNKGLTKETDVRLAKMSIKLEGTKLQLTNEERTRIYDLYWNQHYNLLATAEFLDYSMYQLLYRMRIYGIDRRHDYEGLEKGRYRTNHTHSEETKKLLASYRGELASGWKGGISREPYSFEFNIQLKNLIKQRDNYICQLCGIPEIECRRGLCVHHIDYNKKNTLPLNLISLCHSCNAIVNWDRDYWTKFFTEIMEDIQDKFQLKLRFEEVVIC